MNFNNYVLLICSLVFIALLVFFTIIILHFVKSSLFQIRKGYLDEEIIESISKKEKKKKPIKYLSKALLVLFSIITIASFSFSLTILISEKANINSYGVPKVVNSNSMAYKLDTNTYLKENNLDNQISRFDLIYLSSIPKEDIIRLYDVIAYQNIDGFLYVHRIVEIRKIDNTTYYVFKGDASYSNDPQLVTYSMMKGIYKGKKIPYVGSLIVFLQSPIGYLSLILILFSSFIAPSIKKKMEKEIDKRKDVILSSLEINNQKNLIE